VAFAFHRLGSFQVAQTNTSPGSVSGGHVKTKNESPPLVRRACMRKEQKP